MDDRQTFAIGETIRQKHLDAVARDADRIATQQEAIDELVALARSARLYVEEAVDANGGIDACEIHLRHDLEAIDALLSKHGERT